MEKEIKRELERISQLIEKEENISYGEIAFLQAHTKDLQEITDNPVVLQWAGIEE